MMNICMMVDNDCSHDARVLREAASVAASAPARGARAGHRVIVCAVSDSDLPRCERRDGFEIRRVGFTSWKKRLRQRESAGGDSRTSNPSVAARRFGPAIAMRQSAGLLLDSQEAGAIARAVGNALDDFRVDVFHAHDLPMLAPAAKLARTHRAKLVYDSHELFIDRAMHPPPAAFVRAAWLRRERHLIRRCDAVITVNEALAETLAKRYAIQKPIVVMNAPPASDLPSESDRALLRRAIGANDSEKLLLCVGAIIPHRGLEIAIDALKSLPDCRLVIMGYGTDAYRIALQSLAQDRGVSERLTFFGPVPPEDVVRSASGADVGLIPLEPISLSYRLATPNKLFEFIHAGVPIVASDLPEMRRIIDETDIGVTFKPGDAAGLAEAIRQVLADEGNRTRWRANASAAAERYNWANESRKLCDLYENLDSTSQTTDCPASQAAHDGR